MDKIGFPRVNTPWSCQGFGGGGCRCKQTMWDPQGVCLSTDDCKNSFPKKMNLLKIQFIFLRESYANRFARRERASVKDHPPPSFPHVAMTITFKGGGLTYAARHICTELHLCVLSAWRLSSGFWNGWGQLSGKSAFTFHIIMVSARYHGFKTPFSLRCSQPLKFGKLFLNIHPRLFPFSHGFLFKWLGGRVTNFRKVSGSLWFNKNGNSHSPVGRR